MARGVLIKKYGKEATLDYWCIVLRSSHWEKNLPVIKGSYKIKIDSLD